MDDLDFDTWFDLFRDKCKNLGYNDAKREIRKALGVMD